MTRLTKPIHPGEILRVEIFNPLGITITEASHQLGVTRAALSRVLNCRAAISPEMALRLEMWLGVDLGGHADVWIARQANFDLWQVRNRSKLKIRHISLDRMAA